MATTAIKAQLEPLPERMRDLAIDARGYPVPWFVPWIKGPDGILVPEFRALDRDKWRLAVKLRLCWVCGKPLGRWLAFVLGPMCAITRTTSEPPAHRVCAEWSARNCPFLSEPRAVRREGDMLVGVEGMAGLPIMRNPGVATVWVTRGYEVFNDGRGKPLITIGEAEAVTWWCEGRPATRMEVEASVSSGMPTLLAAAKSDGPFAVEQLGKQTTRAEQLYPAL